MKIDITEVLENAVKKSLKKRGVANSKIEAHVLQLIQRMRKSGLKDTELGYFIDAIDKEDLVFMVF